jgi:hypothetical protein
MNPTPFPRLAAYNPIYEYFVFHNVTYKFLSNQPTTVAGEVFLCIDYDPTDAVPGNSLAMMRNISSTMSNVYSDCSLQALKSLSRLPRYETDVPTTETLQRAQGCLYVGVEGYNNATAGAAIGYIVAQYDIEFFTPQ